MLALLALPVSEIVRHPPLDIGPFLVEIALRLENRAADQGVDSTLDLGNALFEIEIGQSGPELDHQQLAEIRLHFVMARLAVQMPKQRDGFGLVGHARGLRRH